MNAFEALKRAIETRTPVRFSYPGKDGHARQRIVNPHALFTQATTTRICCSVYQVAGDTESRQPLPGWRTFHVERIEDLELIIDDAPFAIAPGFNPQAPMYADAHALVH